MEKAMLRLIAIVAFIAMPAPCADVHEYSDNAMERFSNIIPNPVVYPLRFTKANSAIPFEKRKHPRYDDGLFLYPKVLPTFRNKVNCESFFGIKFAIDLSYCNITMFGLRARTYEKEDDSLELILEMESDFTFPLRLEIPVFKLPSSHATKPQAEIERWAEDKKVALVTPLTDEDLESIHSSDVVLLKFDWLPKVLMFGLSDSDDSGETDSDVYVSSPLVLAAATVEKLLDATTVEYNED